MALQKERSLESWIWDAACSIRGAKDAPKYKGCILPHIFTKRLCDVFDDELNGVVAAASRDSARPCLTNSHRRKDHLLRNQDWFKEADYDTDAAQHDNASADFKGISQVASAARNNRDLFPVRRRGTTPPSSSTPTQASSHAR